MSLVAINRLSAIKNQFRNMSTVHKIVQTASAPAAIGPYCNCFLLFSQLPSIFDAFLEFLMQ